MKIESRRAIVPQFPGGRRRPAGRGARAPVGHRPPLPVSVPGRAGRERPASERVRRRAHPRAPSRPGPCPSPVPARAGSSPGAAAGSTTGRGAGSTSTRPSALASSTNGPPAARIDPMTFSRDGRAIKEAPAGSSSPRHPPRRPVRGRPRLLPRAAGSTPPPPSERCGPKPEALSPAIVEALPVPWEPAQVDSGVRERLQGIRHPAPRPMALALGRFSVTCRTLSCHLICMGSLIGLSTPLARHVWQRMRRARERARQGRSHPAR